MRDKSEYLCHYPACASCFSLGLCQEQARKHTEPCADLENCIDCPSCIADHCNVRKQVRLYNAQHDD